jgi:hypothetical protein
VGWTRFGKGFTFIRTLDLISVVLVHGTCGQFVHDHICVLILVIEVWCQDLEVARFV